MSAAQTSRKRDADRITSAVRGVTRLSRTVERVVGEFQLSLSQFRILDRLVDGMAGGRLLAEWLAVKPPSITTLVDGLVKRGLVERGVDPADRRTVTHSLTAEGEVLHAAVFERIAERLREVLRHLDDEAEAAALIQALGSWNEALDRSREARRVTTGGGA
jgi:long-chain acyl-CoA synthetase